MRSYWAAIVGSMVAVTGCVNDKNKDGITDGVRDPTSVVLNAPSTPTGTVSGQVLTTRLAPLDGVTVSLNAGGLNTASTADAGFIGLTTMTDSSGNFSFTGVPAGGDILVTITKSGYSSVRVTTRVNEVAGNDPLSNANANVGPYVLTQTNATMKFLVVNRSGRPAKGAKATLEAGPSAALVVNDTSFGSTRGSVVVDATAGDDGILTFSNVPGPDELSRLATGGVQYTVTVAALDENGDGVPESAGSVNTYNARALLIDNTMPVIRLPDGRSTQGAFQLLASNVGSFSNVTVPTENILKSTDSVYLVFNHFVLDSSVSVRITDETGKTSVPFTRTLTSGSVLAITPGNLQANKEYNIAVHAVSLDTGAIYDGLGFFFVGDPANPTTPDVVSVVFHDTFSPPATAGDTMLNSGEIVEVTFNQPIGFDGFPNLGIVYFGKDLNGSGTTGDAAGEIGFSGGGYTLQRTEFSGLPDPTNVLPLLPVKQSGYTTRYGFRYNGITIQANADVQLAFNRLTDPAGTLQTIWGQPMPLTPATRQIQVNTQPFLSSFVGL